MRISYQQTRVGASSGQVVSEGDLTTLTTQARQVWSRWLTIYPQRKGKLSKRRPTKLYNYFRFGGD